MSLDKNLRGTGLNSWCIDTILQREIDEILPQCSHIKAAFAYESVPSTNDCAHALEKVGSKSGTVVVANMQTAGRGRLRRSWQMMPGDIALSLILRPPHVPNTLSLLPMIQALAIVDALATLGIAARVKWPNDVLVSSPCGSKLSYFGEFRKIAGILVENIFKDQGAFACIIGIGINVVRNHPMRAQVPHALSVQDLCPTATRALVLRALLPALDRRISYGAQVEGRALINEYASVCETLGRHVRVSGEQAMEGQAIRLNEDGTLVIFDGIKEHTVYAGDIGLSVL